MPLTQRLVELSSTRGDHPLHLPILLLYVGSSYVEAHKWHFECKVSATLIVSAQRRAHHQRIHCFYLGSRRRKAQGLTRLLAGEYVRWTMLLPQLQERTRLASGSHGRLPLVRPLGRQTPVPAHVNAHLSATFDARRRGTRRSPPHPNLQTFPNDPPQSAVRQSSPGREAGFHQCLAIRAASAHVSWVKKARPLPHLCLPRGNTASSSVVCASLAARGPTPSSLAEVSAPNGRPVVFGWSRALAFPARLRLLGWRRAASSSESLGGRAATSASEHPLSPRPLPQQPP
mmetsp:Transcript_27138/g.82270  ORF Transcript_27138/g.82270 Transcript_27138/m.82270 type:complete len:287 (+) Transcript_27138:569-1429(+)